MEFGRECEEKHMRKKVFLMATLFTIGLTACSNESESMSESTQVDYANETQEIVSENTDNLVIDNVEEEIPTESDDTVQEVSEEDWENLLSQGNIFAEYLSKDDMDLTMDLLMRYYIYHWRELPVDPISEVDQDPLNKIAPLANGLAIAKIPLEAIRWIGSNVFALDHVDYTEERCSDDTSIAVTYYPLDGYYYYKEVDYIGWEDCVATEVVNYGILDNGQIYVQVEEVTPYENYSVYLLCKLQNSNDKKYWIFDEISREPLYGNEVFVESTAIQVEQTETTEAEMTETETTETETTETTTKEQTLDGEISLQQVGGVQDTGYSDTELMQMSLACYEDRTGFRPPYAAIDHYDGEMVQIHLFEDNGQNTATCDWYTINRKTAKGTNILGEEIDLSVYAQ